MTQDQSVSGLTYYKLLDLTPVASSTDIRRAYRQKSKLYHPDTTELPAEIASERFRQLNLAYSTLSNPERRSLYDRQLGLGTTNPVRTKRKFPDRDSVIPSALLTNLGPKERPLSPGELFALFLMGLAFVGCLGLALVVGMTRGEMLLQEAQLPAFMQPISALIHHPDSAAVEVVDPTSVQLPLTELNSANATAPSLPPSPYPSEKLKQPIGVTPTPTSSNPILTPSAFESTALESEDSHPASSLLEPLKPPTAAQPTQDVETQKPRGATIGIQIPKIETTALQPDHTAMEIIKDSELPTLNSEPRSQSTQPDAPKS